MPYNNGKIYVDTSTTPNKGVSINDVRSVTGVSSRDLGTICASEHVNKWSKCKPVPIGSISRSETLSGQRYSLTGSVNATDNPWYLGELVSLSNTTSGGLSTTTVLSPDNYNISLYPIAGLWVPVMAWNGTSDLAKVTNALDDIANSSSSSDLHSKAWSKVDWCVFDSSTKVNTYGLPARLQDFSGYDHNASCENGVWCVDNIYSGQTIPIWMYGTTLRDSLTMSDIGKAFANDFEVGVILKSNDSTPEFLQFFSYTDESSGQTMLLRDWTEDFCFPIQASDMPSDYVAKTWYVYHVARFVSGDNYYWMLLPNTSTYPNPREFFAYSQAAVNPFDGDTLEITAMRHMPYPSFSESGWLTGDTNYIGISSGTLGKYCIALTITNNATSEKTVDFKDVHFYWQYCGQNQDSSKGGGQNDYFLYEYTSSAITQVTGTNWNVTWATGETKVLIFDFGMQGVNGTNDNSSYSVFTATDGTTYDTSELDGLTQDGFLTMDSPLNMYYVNEDVEGFIDFFTITPLYINSSESILKNTYAGHTVSDDGGSYSVIL